MTGADPRELAGRWRLRRRVTDRGTGQSGVMAGELAVAPDRDGLRWDERGTLRWAGAELPATRSYRLRPDGAGWVVEFADGRPFHPWRPGEVVTHRCRADLYTGLVTVSADRIHTFWNVRGPTKTHHLTTRLRRTAG